MGFVRKHTGLDLTGGGASDAAGDAARRQEKMARAGLKALRADLEPFRQVGSTAANELMGSIYNPTAQDPNQVLQNPFFQALANQQQNELLQNRAALGLGSSGGTQDILMRNLMLLGRDFQQQDLNNQLTQNQQRFGQLFNTAGMGANAAAQTGTNSLQTMNNIGQIQSVPGMIGAQVAANQGQQFMQALPGFLSGMGIGGFGGGMGAGIGGLLGQGLGALGGLFGGGSAAAPTGGVSFNASRWGM